MRTREVGKKLNLASTLSHAEPRQVTNDYTVSWAGQKWQLPKEAVRPGMKGCKIRMEERLDGALMARIGNQFVALSLCQDAKKRPQKTSQPAKRHVPKPGESRWMDRFQVQGNEAWAAYRRDQAAGVSTLLQSPCGLPRQVETG
jgi:hypothetical protein